MRKSLLLATLLLSAAAGAQELQPVNLPRPKTEGGKPLMQVLNERQSRREFAPDRLEPQALSNLLWAAFGVNRADSGKRTAPSANNRQDIEIYVALAEGLYLYEPKDHRLKPVLKEDIRALTGTQPFVGEAPVNLIYVSDFSKWGKSSPENRLMYSGAHAGYISQNVYLYCASEGLATVVRGSIDRDALAKAMKLGPDRKIILAQTVGRPKK